MIPIIFIFFIYLFNDILICVFIYTLFYHVFKVIFVYDVYIGHLDQYKAS